MKRMTLLLLTIYIYFLPFHVYAQKKVPIILYHSIDEYTGLGSKELYVTPKNFEKQIEYLKNNGYTLLTFEQWDNINRVNKPIFITLDDGYKNNLNAFKIFQKLKDSQFKPKATIFIISDFIGRSNRLNKQNIKQMAGSSMFSFQSHTATHPDLTTTTNYVHELKDSKEMIARMTNKPVLAIAYPYGSFNQQVVSEAKKYYQFGLTTTPEAYVPTGQENELYLLPRIYIKNSTTMEEFEKIVQNK